MTKSKMKVIVKELRAKSVLVSKHQVLTACSPVLTLKIITESKSQGAKLFTGRPNVIYDIPIISQGHDF